MTSKPIPRDTSKYDSIKEYGRRLGMEALLVDMARTKYYEKIVNAARLLKDRKYCKVIINGL